MDEDKALKMYQDKFGKIPQIILLGKADPDEIILKLLEAIEENVPIADIENIDLAKV
jgi:hypothetical protein